MKTKLTLQEKLRDLREERKLKLTEVSEATGIPTSTLQRFESEDNARVGYQDIEVLTRFYCVSADYLFGLTDNRQHSNVGIDKLFLSDKAVSELMSGKLNNRLLSELITHADFAELLAALEVFIDRSISENINIINMSFKTVVDTINKQSVTVGRDEYISTLKEATIDPDGYLRYRLTQKFEKIAQSLYDAHIKESQSENGMGYLEMLGKQLQEFQSTKEETGSTEEAKLALLADQLGVNFSKAQEDEKRSLLNLFKRSKFAQFFRRRK